MSGGHKSAQIRGHSAAYPRGHGYKGASMDGRLTYDIVEAASIMRSETARVMRQQAEKKKRSKVSVITLAETRPSWKV